MNNDVFTSAGAAHYLGITVARIGDLVKDGTLTCSKVGFYRRFHKTDLDEYKMHNSVSRGQMIDAIIKTKEKLENRKQDSYRKYVDGLDLFSIKRLYRHYEHDLFVDIPQAKEHFKG